MMKVLDGQVVCNALTKIDLDFYIFPSPLLSLLQYDNVVARTLLFTSQ